MYVEKYKIPLKKYALNISKERLHFDCHNSAKIELYQCDAKKMTMIKDNSIDFICTHPPYANIMYNISIFSNIANHKRTIMSLF